MRTLIGALCVAVVPFAAAAAVVLPGDVTTADVCTVVPGGDVARALGATLVEAKLVRPGGTHARCVYTLTLPGAEGARAAFVLWLHAANDFEALRTYQESPATAVEGLGDAAFTSLDRDTGRHILVVLLRGVATVELTGPDAVTVRGVAKAAIGRLRPAQ